ncbi:uncharacterized protein [Antedon mediterranea]|uniref:uncharacterized protein n=1 Tax=Antedon mediterranea TaxID=105859 RepID=UPI003AF76D21
MSVADLQDSERFICKCTQAEYFKSEIEILRKVKQSGEITERNLARMRKVTLKRTSCMYKLDPFLDENGILRVGGRIRNAMLPLDVTNPVILPKKCKVTDLIIQHYHQEINHMGRSTTHNRICQSGYWIIGASSAVSTIIHGCVTCRRLRDGLQTQKMADLPKDRLENHPPFTYCAVDIFGPFYIRERRSRLKRYGVVFTCMYSGAIHMESVNTLRS